MSATELEHAVQKLSPEQLERFSERLEHFTASRRDATLASDIAAGKLAAAAQNADQDLEVGRCTPW